LVSLDKASPDKQTEEGVNHKDDKGNVEASRSLDLKFKEWHALWIDINVVCIFSTSVRAYSSVRSPSVIVGVIRLIVTFGANSIVKTILIISWLTRLTKRS
jgi:hypothetical protein